MAVLMAAARGYAALPIPTRRLIQAAAAALAACLIALAAFVAGEHQQEQARVLTGVAYVGYDQASIATPNWVYAVPSNVTWLDAQGSTHDSGWPACLTGIGSKVRVTFAAVPVIIPGGQAERQVVWVHC